MDYIKNRDIQVRVGPQAYVQLADDDGDGEADVEVVDAIRIAAQAEVNAYLAPRYRVPIDTRNYAELAGLLATVTLDLAEYRLRARRPPVPEVVERVHAQTLEWLRRLGEGTVTLPAVAPIPPNPLHGPRGRAVGEARRLSHDELSEY